MDPLTRHLADSNINILLTRNVLIDPGVRQRSHLLMIVIFEPFHRLWAKLNNRTRVQFECDMTCLYFCFDFGRSHARCGCCFMVPKLDNFHGRHIYIVPNSLSKLKSIVEFVPFIPHL